MASVIPGFEYDIFISYRQKDNKYDGWVTDFVDNLKKELEATFKEEISVYFDINPHDGLLETHDVDASLKDKLRCLVFIPILSRTYCDPKSFAWEHEFKIFVEQASHDQFGLRIKLPNGNVASRVLPVRIHDLDIADIKLCEFILDGVLRGIEFIYKEPGVNRSLTPDDDEKKNLNKTKYRNQINKVALAVNEIIQGLKTEPEWLRLKEKIDRDSFRKPGKELKVKTGKPIRRKIIWFSAFAAILIIAAILVRPTLNKKDTLEKLRSPGGKISIAVMPFRNITDDTTRNSWQRWIQYNLINSLSNTEQLIIRQTESIDNLIRNRGLDNISITPALASSISKKLDTDIFIYGSIGQAGPAVRVYVQLIDSKTEEVFKTFQVEGSAAEENIFKITDTLSAMVKDFLVLSGMKQSTFLNPQLLLVSTNSPEAFSNYLTGVDAFAKMDFDTAIEYLVRALKEDQDFTFASILLTWSYYNLGQYDKAKECLLKAWGKKDLLPMHIKTKLMDVHAFLFEGPRGRIKYLEQLKNIDDQDSWTYFDLGHCYNILAQYDKAIPEFEKALELFDKWDVKPSWAPNYTQLGSAYHQTGQYRKEKKLYVKAARDFPDNYRILERQAILELSQGNENKANSYLERYISIRRDNLTSEATIMLSLADIYSGADLPDKAEEYCRKTLSSEPDNPWIINSVARFLINNNPDINEGLELVNKALALNPDNYLFLDTKGVGLFKQGKFDEALALFEKSWELKPLYDHDLYLHLEAAKKAVTGQ